MSDFEKEFDAAIEEICGKRLSNNSSDESIFGQFGSYGTKADRHKNLKLEYKIFREFVKRNTIQIFGDPKAGDRILEDFDHYLQYKLGGYNYSKKSKIFKCPECHKELEITLETQPIEPIRPDFWQMDNPLMYYEREEIFCPFCGRGRYSFVNSKILEINYERSDHK